MGGSAWDDYDIYVMNADGSEPRRLTRMKYNNANSPHFTADGEWVIFAGNTNNYPASSAPLLLEVVADRAEPPRPWAPARTAGAPRNPAAAPARVRGAMSLASLPVARPSHSYPTGLATGSTTST